MPESFFKGPEAVLGDIARVQRGSCAGYKGRVGMRQGSRLLLCPYEGASWTAFWVDDVGVAVVRFST